MKCSDGQSEFSRVFNFTILCYSRNSRKLDAHKKISVLQYDAGELSVNATLVYSEFSP